MTEPIAPVTGSVICGPDTQPALWFLGALSQVRVGVRQKCGADAFSQVALLIWSRMSQPDRNVLVSDVRQARSPANSPSDGTVTTRQALSELR